MGPVPFNRLPCLVSVGDDVPSPAVTSCTRISCYLGWGGGRASLSEEKLRRDGWTDLWGRRRQEVVDPDVKRMIRHSAHTE